MKQTIMIPAEITVDDNDTRICSTDCKYLLGRGVTTMNGEIKAYSICHLGGTSRKCFDNHYRPTRHNVCLNAAKVNTDD